MIVFPERVKTYVLLKTDYAPTNLKVANDNEMINESSRPVSPNTAG